MLTRVKHPNWRLGRWPMTIHHQVAARYEVLHKAGGCDKLIWCGGIVDTVCPTCYQTGISWIILTPMKILQRNLNRGTFVVWEMKRNVSVVCVCSAPIILISGKIIKEMPGSVASGTHCTCENNNRPTGLKKCGEFLDYLRHYQLLKESAPLSWL
jgi:hypothetical protein